MAAKTSFEFDDEIFAAFRAHVSGLKPRTSMTAALEGLMLRVLREHGKDPGSPTADVAAKAVELAQAIGADEVNRMLEERAALVATSASAGE